MNKASYISQLPLCRSSYRVNKWITKPWVVFACFTPATVTVFLNTLAGGMVADSLWHIIFAFSVFFSLVILSDRPLINPIQTFVFLAYGWLSLDPCVETLWDVWNHGGSDVAFLVNRGIKTLWLFSLGLPLYAIASRSVLDLLEKEKLWLRFLQPGGFYFRPKTILTFLSVGILTHVLMKLFGISGAGPLGLGMAAGVPWYFYLIQSFTGKVAEMGIVGVLWYVVAPKRDKISRRWKRIGWLILGCSVISAIPSGSKGAIIQPFLLLGVILTVRKQSPPFKILLATLIILVFVVFPFVTDFRYVAQSSAISNKSEAASLAWQRLSSFEFHDVSERGDFNPAFIFRGIYNYAGIVADRSDFFSGPWDGYTYSRGFLALIPRVIYPEKPDLNIGNFIANDLGVYLDDLTNIGVSLPVEAWGNFGALVALISFVFIGIVWSLICGVILSPQRIHNHPIAPLFVLQTMYFEAPIAHFMAKTLKVYPFMLIGAWILNKFFLKKL